MMMEKNLRRALLLSRGDRSVLVTRPISAVMLFLAVVMLASVGLASTKNQREETFVEGAANSMS